MKRLLVQVAMCLLMVAVLASAQAQQGRGRRSGQGNPNPGTPPDPQQMLQNRIDRLTSMLNLTDTQKSQATTIFGDSAKATQPLSQQMRETRKSLQDAVRTNNTAQIDQLAATIGTLMGQITAIESKAEAQFIATLTADQKAKLPNEGFGLFGGFGPGGPGGGSGGRRQPPPNQ
jgi:Spy/CpxP family protein refolding chaperone